MTGLITALFILTSCTQPAAPATPEPTTPPTAVPTATPRSTATPTVEPTPTPTYSHQANQLLLANGRFTTLLDELTQEIGRELSDAEQEQVLALARALWLPQPAAGLTDHLDESDWLPDPAGVTLHWLPALDGREGPVVRVVEAQPDSPYAAGALIFWQAERLLSLTPGGVGYYFEFGRILQNGWDFETWVEYDAEGNLHSFVHPDTMQYVTPQGDGTFFILSDLGPDGRPTNGQYYWKNGGEPILITTSPQAELSIADFLQSNPHLLLIQTEQAGQQMVTLEDTETGEVRWTLNADMEWEEAVTVEFVGGWGVANGQVYREGDSGPHEHMNEAMSRGGLEPLSVWQDQDTETTYFKVNYEGRELEAEIKDRHAGIGRALIVRDVFVSEPNPNMPPASNLRIWNQELAPGIHIAVIDNPQFVNIATDWVVFVNPAVDMPRDGYWQARGLFRGYTGGQLVYLTVPFRSTFTTATGYWFDLGNLESDLGEDKRLESGDIWRDIKVNYPTGSGRTHSSQNEFYNRGRFSSGEGKFMIGRFRPIQGENETYKNDGTYQSIIEAVMSGEIDEDVYMVSFVSLPFGK